MPFKARPCRADKTNVGNQPTVLVVENHSEVREIVANMVADQGWRAVKVGSIADAIACLKHERIDAVISDWELDDGDGDQILRQVRRARKPIPTVMISSYASPELVAQARSSGAIDMLAKPFRIEELTALLSQKLAR